MKWLPWMSLAALVVGGAIWAAKKVVGRQEDGTFVVSTGVKIQPGTLSFGGRPMELAIHPTSELCAVATNREVFLVDSSKVIESSKLKLDAGVSYRGMIWTGNGQQLFLSLSNGKIAHFEFASEKLIALDPIEIAPGAPRKDVVPGGMCLSKDDSTLYVVEANGGQAVAIDVATAKVINRWKVGNIPFDCRLSEDGHTLIVSNWAGREATTTEIEDEETDESDGVAILVDKRGTAKSGTVSLIDLSTGSRKDVDVGVHPCGLATAGDRAWVANAGSDSISEIDLSTNSLKRTFRVAWNSKMLFGSMPNSLAQRGNTLFLCNGGDNAICEVDLDSGKVRGFRPAGYFPVSVQISGDGSKAFVCNTKGNGSVAQTTQGKPGGVHDFQGSVSVIDLSADLEQSTKQVAEFNEWTNGSPSQIPDLDVFQGKIKHVLYIIKENKTYDSIFGDMEIGDGDKSLCQFPEEVTPNAHKLVREFTLFDNAYVVGTNSAEGHQWAIEGLANDYIERFYGGYSRSYPYDGSDPMAYSKGGFLWDSVLDARKSVRNYGEFCADRYIKILPSGTKWIDAWQDREAKAGKVKITSTIGVKRMRPFTHPSYPCWPISISDQYRADTFIEEYRELSAKDKVPNLTLMILPCDHGAGTNPAYPTPRAMVADNDLALGRVIEAVSQSPQWEETAIIVMQDDAQSALDHIDGHRTVMMVVSPYARRGYVDSTFYTQISVIRTITAMLGTKPLTRFDATASPLTACFTDQADLTPFKSVVNRIPLDEMNKPLKKTTGKERFWAEKSMQLDLSEVDSADWYWLNRIHWAATKGWNTPYPE
ncbi:MAG: bifunctional YncE family protein/alkaline phosphatase family protein [Fimbriimonadaceae bacterium]|nr:bifunctional YncE family protein/alkaline phosphatase family protein [Fimbriimonadaceae bacterium]